MDNLKEIVGFLAGGGRIVLEGDGYSNHPALRGPTPSMDGPTWSRLCREGWIASMANGGTFKLSDAGLRAYLRSTDEMSSGELAITENTNG